MKLPIRLASAALLAAATATATVTAGAGAQPRRPAVRALGPTVARAAEAFGNVSGVRHLSDGRVLVNDPVRRRVVLYDSALAPVAVVADSTSGTAGAYGPRQGGLIAYRGDSTLFVDAASLSMLVIDPRGKIARVMSVPRAQDVLSLANVFGPAGYDGRGRLVYRALPQFRMRAAAPDGQFVPPEQPDSAAILRVDLATRTVDTAAFIKIPKLRMVTTRTEGRTTATSEVNPLPVTDDWALTSTGQIALVRGRDYHVDWVGADGARTSSPKVPFEWRRLSDAEKVALVDSVKAARERLVASGAVTSTFGDGRPSQARVAGADPGPGGSPGVFMTIREGGPGDGPPPRARAGADGGAPAMPALTYVSPSELPDYQPPFFAGAVRPDADGNLWVLTIPTKALPGGPVYDVLNGRGELVDRVQLPANRTVAGFGAGGVVYLARRDAQGVHLERAMLR